MSMGMLWQGVDIGKRGRQTDGFTEFGQEKKKTRFLHDIDNLEL